MLTVKLITVGTLKEAYLRDAFDEYAKRLSAFCALKPVQLKESRLPSDPSAAQIRQALDEESAAILSQIGPKAKAVALCVEGQEFSSESLAATLEGWMQTTGELCLIIGSAYGLSDTVKARADLKLSLSRLTFSHQLTRVLLMEVLYRSFSILHGGHYHK